MGRLRVLHFAEVINRSDFIDTVLSRLDRSRFEVRALVGRSGGRTGEYPPGVPYAKHVLGFSFGFWHLGQMLASLGSEIRAFRPHILHSHHFNETLVASLVKRLMGIPAYVIGRHYSDHIYFLTRGLKRQLLLRAEGFCNRTADRIIVPTQSVASLLTKRQGVPAERITTIPYALELSLLRATTQDAARRFLAAEGLDKTYNIVTACRLNREKGIEHLLAAMPEIRAKNAAARLLILGGGPYEQELRSRASAMGIDDCVRFAGWRDDALEWIAAADVVVQPSECESYCQVLVEALMLGTPVVMTSVGVAPEVMADHRGGRLVPARDSAAIAEAVGELMANPALGPALAKSGRDYVVQHMDPARITLQHESVYIELPGVRQFAR